MTLSCICPFDHHALSETSTALFCAMCGRLYLVESGVVCTLDHRDDFYEGAYDNQVRFLPRSEALWHIWPVWLINSGYLWTVRRAVPAGATVVELGCAGGVRYFGRRYRMVGCDLSVSSLQKIESYEKRIQADAGACIPLPEHSVDAVVSSYFWEHIPPALKPHILRECRRILKPGGKIVFLYDVETRNSLIQHYKTLDPLLYGKLFLEGDGHLGYQRPQDNLAIFEGAGFRVVEHHGMEKTWLQSPPVYIKLAQFGSRGRLFFRVASRLGRRPLFHLYTVLMRAIDALISPWLPADWARIDMVVCEKKAE